MDRDKYIGRLLDNRYEIIEVIGTGGMAVVYKARCHRLNRLVAIKILKDEYSQDEEFRRRFHAESQAVAMLSHPNIVSVYDVSTSDEADYIVMELIDGITLKQYMEKKGILNWKETLHFAIQIAKALEHAHGRGIVHRDIKPHNIMVLKNGSVKVADFGIARVMSKSNTLTKEALGSVHYISPEQAKGGRVDNRSDIYSLGVVMYEMMTGRPPYDGESPVAVAIQHIKGGAAMPSTLNPNIPGGLEQIIMKAMAHDPNMRYTSATAMLYDMDEFRKDPAMLFDYNIPPLDEVTRLHTVPTPLEAQPPRTIAERTAGEAGRPRQDPNLRRRTSANSGRSAAGSSRPGTRSAGTSGRSGTPSGTQSPKKRREEAEAEEENRSRVATIAIVACSVVAIIAISIFLVTLLNGGLMGPTDDLVVVPQLLGEVYEELPQYADIVVKLQDRKYDETYEKGQIMHQEPAFGAKVVKGSKVYVVVSMGKEPQAKIMENLLEMDAARAESFLQRQDPTLQILVREENHDTIGEGLVVRTEPREGEPLTSGQTVTLWISKGPAVVKSKMPYVVGLNYSTALDVLDKSGFKNVRYEPVDSNEDKDEVVWQSVERNKEIDVTTEIVLRISNGPTQPPSTEPPTQPPTTEPPTQPPETKPMVTKVVEFDLPEDMVVNYKLTIKLGNTVISELEVTPETTSYRIELTNSGIQHYDMYINDIYFKTETVNFGAE